jgi:hypothetical protein
MKNPILTAKVARKIRKVDINLFPDNQPARLDGIPDIRDADKTPRFTQKIIQNAL